MAGAALFFEHYDNAERTAKGCRIWPLSKDIWGYGRYQYEGRTQSAHRLAYMLLVGPIPTGLEIDHLCCNPSCVEVTHLEPVTHAVNIRRSKKNHCPAGHPYSGENLYVKGGARRCRICMTEQRRRRYEQRKAEYESGLVTRERCPECGLLPPISRKGGGQLAPADWRAVTRNDAPEGAPHR
jgi:hypothetical protein